MSAKSNQRIQNYFYSANSLTLYIFGEKTPIPSSLNGDTNHFLIIIHFGYNNPKIDLNKIYNKYKILY